MIEPVYEKGYPSYEAVNRESYEDYMIRRIREEEETRKRNSPSSKVDELIKILERIEKKLDKLL